MKRCALMLTLALTIAATGCCCPFAQRGCAPCGYGAGYSPYNTYSAPASPCPNGACGTYPGAYTGGAPTAMAPYAYPMTATVDPLPAY
ncbi:hypothetical protein KOR42_04430 [Thalassoglobus neptunius]|uniref:Lipoprotein n=1 Tax=Thalassoglobus neptunius TaxID=1938619 RepID=A0A5C5X4G4_9PLAN|nr:hypothetical protein [Thalassoglobus neptunius]TWT57085.1 hypothetical protein KOR42_04430 [Thalassoglobus neptunius]